MGCGSRSKDAKKFWAARSEPNVSLYSRTGSYKERDELTGLRRGTFTRSTVCGLRLRSDLTARRFGLRKFERLLLAQPLRVDLEELVRDDADDGERSARVGDRRQERVRDDRGHDGRCGMRLVRSMGAVYASPVRCSCGALDVRGDVEPWRDF